ncbi:MAG TPA: hypothetical protein VHD87_02765 [Acidimicrobiales bacterium]|nr:hypothetical protein [Acidimicrobiales bacterium]
MTLTTRANKTTSGTSSWLTDGLRIADAAIDDLRAALEAAGVLDDVGPGHDAAAGDYCGEAL